MSDLNNREKTHPWWKLWSLKIFYGHEVPSAVFYWSHRITLIACRRKLYKSMNKQKARNIGSSFGGWLQHFNFIQDIFLISFWTFIFDSLKVMLLFMFSFFYSHKMCFLWFKFLNLLRFVLWPRRWCILVNVFVQLKRMFTLLVKCYKNVNQNS